MIENKFYGLHDSLLYECSFPPNSQPHPSTPPQRLRRPLRHSSDEDWIDLNVISSRGADASQCQLCLIGRPHGNAQRRGFVVLSSAPLSVVLLVTFFDNLEMASPSVDPDIEAQINTVTGTQPAIIPNPPPPNTANLQLPTTSDPRPQTTNTNEHHGGNAPANTPGNSQVQRSMLTFPFAKS